MSISIAKNRITLTVIVLLAFVALMAGLFTAHYLHVEKPIDQEQFHGTLLTKSREMGSFSLMGIDKQPFTNANLQGQWTFIFFGFTNCGYLCPTTMAELAKMYRQLAKEKITPLPKVVMISLDPQRDSLQKLSQYVKAFDPHFYGAKGSPKKISELTKEIGVAYAKVALPPANDQQNYDIQHNGAILLFNPQGELSAFFTNPHEAALLAQDYQNLVS